MALYKSLESFTYGSGIGGTTPEVIGGSAPTHQTAILDNSMMYVTTEDDVELVCRFVVMVAPSGNADTDYNSLNSQCQAVESALRQRYQYLEVDWGAGANAVEIFDPSTTDGATQEHMGFSAEPHLEKVKDWPNSGESRAYDFRVRIARPPNYTDVYGPAAGRRQVDVNLHYDVDQRLIVTMVGSWTQVPSALARANFLSQFTGATGYAAYRLGLINSTDPGQSSDTWALTRSEASDPNDLSVLRFTYEFQQHVFGRRGSTTEIFYLETGQRIVTIRGTYLRTVTGTIFGGAAASSANFLDAVNGGYAFAVGTTLPNLVTAQGGPLTVGQNCELLREPFVTTNEEDDRTDYSLAFRELIQQQSVAASFLDDPNIVNDSIQVAAKFNEVNDSPGPPPAASIPAPGPSGALSLGSQNANAAPVVAVKPVDLFVNYAAFFVKSLENCYDYFFNNVLPLLIETLTEEFSLTGSEFVDFREDTTRTDHRVGGTLHLRAYNTNVIVFNATIGLFNHLGLRVDPAFSGTPHAYLVQQALPRATQSRRIEAIFKAGTFDFSQYVTPPTMTGWVPLTNALPQTATKVLGIPALGVPQQPLTYAVYEESLIWVAQNVGQAGGGSTVSPGPTASPVSSGGGGGGPSIPSAPASASIAVATGIG